MSTLPLGAIVANLQRERSRVGWLMAELARRAGVAKSTLSQLEAASGNPSLETLWALATALDVSFAQLVGSQPADVTVIRAGEGPRVAAELGGYVATLLSASPPGARRDLYLIDAEPESPRTSDPHPVGTVEHVVLCSGRALVGPAGDPITLAPGDFITYAGDAPHVFEALEPGTRAVLISEQR